ncbi:uncharacterized protein BXZ73DRAFT_36990 [Epithele typhae]|uniref:uncharacterized protein n=1 Tax=Epithele typhae TaxID=378194 RepID=UPI002007674C|nr:uncharacterized protein BXZ73DRAFT_36990 [Epithele typhae]KAH9945952.1 hypothetical protein BXZ73DRAFT_36990 [Epithele typhae]
MAKKKKTAPAAATAATSQTKPVQVVFPPLSLKEDIRPRVLLEDQIILFDDLFSSEECKAYVKFIDNLPLEPTPPPKKGEAERVNHRISIPSVDFAQRLFTVLAPHLPEFPCPASAKRPANAIGRAAHSLNSNIRLYKYHAGQYFGPHYDDSVRDTATGAKSEWTLLIYLTGEQDGVQGGETIFYKEQRGKPTESIIPPLHRGTALLHRHGQDCLLHEGSPVLKGTKYVLRSDVMFTR